MSEDNNHGHDRTVTIIVNAREHKWAKETISYEDVVGLAFQNPSHEEGVVYTVTYSKGENPKEGMLVKGQSVKVKNGMVFNVTQTNRS